MIRDEMMARMTMREFYERIALMEMDAKEAKRSGRQSPEEMRLALRKAAR